MTVRLATLDDAKMMGEIHYYTWLSTYARIIDEGFLKAQSIQKSIEIFKKNQCLNHLVVEVDDQIVGFVGYGSSRDQDLLGYGEIQGLYVLKAYQHQGCGKALLDEALKILHNMGYLKVNLWVLKDNQQAIRFYEQQGFHHDGTEKQLLLGRPITEWRFQKEINHGTEDNN